MSKSAVADVYAKVIADVCNSSRADFEEGGVDLDALRRLEQGWKHRLSQARVATFPWDPKPEPIRPDPASLNVKQSHLNNGPANSPRSNVSTPGPVIKQDSVKPEPIKGEGQPYIAQAPVPNHYTAPYYAPQQQVQVPAQPGQIRRTEAQQIAAMNLQRRFQDGQAASQVAELQAGRVAHGSLQSQAPLQRQPQIKQETPKLENASINHAAQHPAAYNMMSVKHSQNDGAGDPRELYEAEIACRRRSIVQHRRAGDRLIRDHVIATQRDLEGGGLMQPLQVSQPTNTLAPSSGGTSASAHSSLERRQGDAAGDDDEDEDAINSDLDDPDELEAGINDEETVADTMLCTYDKVQRVKNKWKCTLKDGVLKVNGQDYVFHKGQGEFEW